MVSAKDADKADIDLSFLDVRVLWFTSFGEVGETTALP